MSKIQTIAVDVDDVLAASAEQFVAYSNARWATRLTIEDYMEHWGVMWQLDNDAVRQRSDEWHNSEEIRSIRHHEDAGDVLRSLAHDYRLIVVTARRIVLKDDTLSWLDTYFKEVFDDVHFCGFWDKITDESHALTKAEICKSLGADYLIDDQPKHIRAVAEAGITGLLYGDYAWTRAVDDLPRNAFKVPSWQAVSDFFDGQRKSR